MAADRDLQLIATRFAKGIDELSSRISARQRQELKELEGFDTPAVWEATRAMTRESRLTQASHLTNGQNVPTSCPPADVEAARMAARAGLSAMVVLQLYRVGHDESWKAWLEAIDEAEIEDVARRQCRREISDFVVHYDHAVATLVSEEFERQRYLADADERDQLSLIRRLLDGSTDQAWGLDYRLDQVHLGVIVWGEDIDKTLRRLQRHLSADRLTAEIEDGLTMAWIGIGRHSGSDARSLVERLKLSHKTQLAFGTPAPGTKGFRRTHRQAGEAYLVAARGGNRVTFYDDVQLEVMALSDQTRAREFVASQLDGLGRDDLESRRLRETISAYFGASQNAVATAARLQVHPHTVARRLSVAEERLGRPINRRRPELEFALRLKALLGTLILAALIPMGCGDDETSHQEIEAAVERFYTATGDRDVAGICDSMIVLAPGELGSFTSDDFANKIEEQDRWCEDDLNQGLRGFVDNFPAGGGSVDVVEAATTVNGATAHTRVEGERNGKPDSGTLKLAKPSDGDWRVVLTFRVD